MASRMENCSMRGMIHITASTYKILKKFYPEIRCSLRGQINIQVNLSTVPYTSYDMERHIFQNFGICTTYHIMARNSAFEEE